MSRIQWLYDVYLCFAGSHRGHYFLDVPGITFSVGARLNPHQGVEPRSVQISLDLGKVNLQLDVMQKLLKAMKERNDGDGTREEIFAATGLHNPPIASSQASGAWGSPLSPVSPFMGALSVSSLVIKPCIVRVVAQLSARPLCVGDGLRNIL